jgi:hypothetical protein
VAHTGEFYSMAQSNPDPKKGTLAPINNDPSFEGLYRVTTYEDFFEKRKTTNGDGDGARSTDKDKAKERA